jgi:hypothetical protein
MPPQLSELTTPRPGPGLVVHGRRRHRRGPPRPLPRRRRPRRLAIAALAANAMMPGRDPALRVNMLVQLAGEAIELERAAAGARPATNILVDSVVDRESPFLVSGGALDGFYTAVCLDPPPPAWSRRPTPTRSSSRRATGRTSRPSPASAGTMSSSSLAPPARRDRRSRLRRRRAPCRAKGSPATNLSTA